MVSMETALNASKATCGLEDHLGYWLRLVSNAVSGEFARALQAKGASVSEWVLLRILAECGRATPSELADHMRTTRGAVSKVIDKLEAKGWLEIKGTKEDKRVRILILSRAGHRNLPSLADIADENETLFFNCLNASERSTLQRLLAKLADCNQIHDVPTE